MKIDRVILTLTANPLYTAYWNFVSEVWRTKYDILPTLIFYGSEKELEDCRLSAQFGEIHRLHRVDSVTVDRQQEWACTWALFYGATLFPQDLCMLSGIDQVPLNGAFFDSFRTNEVRSKYTVGLADAYYPNPSDPRATFPSSHHVATGTKFKEVFGLNGSWDEEVVKVFNRRNDFKTSNVFWGLDEEYSSDILRRRALSPHTDVVLMRFFWEHLNPNRLYRGKDKLATFDWEGIRAGRYSEWHGDRPFDPQSQHVAKLKEAIPVYKWQ